MLKEIIKWFSEKPIIFNFLRRIIEFNFISIKQTIIKELSLNNLIPNNEHKRILDVPCGTGEFCKLFDPVSYVGIDISQKYVNYARKTYRRTFYCRDARQNKFEDFYFDNVLILGLFHHLDIPSIISVLKETKRVLKPYGKILLIEDAPIKSRWNFIGKYLQIYDTGDNIRFAEVYREILEKYFILDRYYPIESGFWNYSVFVLSPK